MVDPAGFEPATSRLERSNSNLHHGSCERVGGEQARLNCPCGRAELRPFGRQALTLRPPRERGALSEVTVLFTTAGNGCRGTGEIALPLARPVACSATELRPGANAGTEGIEPSTLRSRSSKSLHHRYLIGALGNGRNRFSAELNAGPSSRSDRNPRHTRPREADSTVRETQAGFEPALPLHEVTGIFTTSASPARTRAKASRGTDERGLASRPVGRTMDPPSSPPGIKCHGETRQRTKIDKQILVAALSTMARRLKRTRSVRPAIGVRLLASFPPAGPALLGRARCPARAPGSGSPVRLSPRPSNERRRRETKNPSGAWAREGSEEIGLSLPLTR
jgi:hypothetical protein